MDDLSSLYQRFIDSDRSITTDSRHCPPGSIFFALKGPSFDGNRFAADALAKGCSIAVVDDPTVAERINRSMTKDGEKEGPAMLVDDVLSVLRQLSRHHRETLGTDLIAITGTNGKTTTKELVTAALRQGYRVLSTQGNFNNDIGVPKTLLRLSDDDEIAVVEMGASHRGDIKRLLEIAEPDSGIITNVGRAHLEGFGSFEGVLRTKGELYDYLRETVSKLAFINGGDKNLMRIADGLHLIRYGIRGADRLDIEGDNIVSDPLLTFRWRLTSDARHWYTVRSKLVGEYNIYNMLAAAAVGIHYGVSPERISDALSDYTPANQRSQLLRTARNTLIIDTYNANPSSMAAAFDSFRLIASDKPRMVILGDMLELGAAAAREHKKIVGSLPSLGLSEAWLVGPLFTAAAAEAPFSQPKIVTFDNVDAVKDYLEKNPVSFRLILIKGSNGMSLYRLPPLL